MAHSSFWEPETRLQVEGLNNMQASFWKVILAGVPGVAGIIVVLQVVLADDPALVGASSARELAVHPIGRVEKKEGRTFLVINPKYRPGLLGLDQWSHVHVLWWLDRNDTPQRRSILQVHPRGNKDNPLTGVFACRAPVRPNPVALTVCQVLAVEDHVIEIAEIDAFDGTPIVDLKPFVPAMDCPHNVRVPAWARPKQKEN